MAPKPRYVLPLNFRSEDKPLLDQILLLAKREDASITVLVRSALREFAERRHFLDHGETHKIEEFCPTPHATKASPFLGDVLTPTELKGWEDSTLLSTAKVIRARAQEIDLELRKRGYHFSW